MTPEQLRVLVDGLLRDLDGRSGYSISSVDPETLDDWRREWVSIIANALLNAGVGIRIPIPNTDGWTITRAKTDDE